jgi:hypothetical protein
MSWQKIGETALHIASARLRDHGFSRVTAQPSRYWRESIVDPVTDAIGRGSRIHQNRGYLCRLKTRFVVLPSGFLTFKSSSAEPSEKEGSGQLPGIAWQKNNLGGSGVADGGHGSLNGLGPT